MDANHLHDHPQSKKVKSRLARVIGHLEGVARMVDEGADCSDVLIQLSAVRAAINGTAKILLDDHINHCLSRAYGENDTDMIQRINEAINRYLNLK